jgi:hypothetical protein
MSGLISKIDNYDKYDNYDEIALAEKMKEIKLIEADVLSSTEAKAKGVIETLSANKLSEFITTQLNSNNVWKTY